MEYAIKVTQEILDNNPVVEIEIGKFYKQNKIPEYWNGQEGYHHQPESVHHADKWYELIHKDFDSLTHKERKNKIVKATDENDNIIPHKYMYKIIELTQEQIDALVLANEDNEDENDVITEAGAGRELEVFTRKHLKRRIKRELLDVADEKTVRKKLFNSFLRLNTGDWDLAKDLADNIPTHNNEFVEAQIQWFRNQINNYLVT